MPMFNFADLEPDKKPVENKPSQPPKAPPKNLKPPMAPKQVKKEELIESVEFEIDWNKVAQSSDFKRAVYLALEGKAWRGSNEKLERELNKKVQVFRDPSFSNVIKELQDNFKNGFIKPSQMS